MRIAICDDDENQIKYLRKKLNEWVTHKPFALVIDEYISAESFLFNYPDHPCDLALLDIEMAGLNGMELAKKLRSKGDMLPIIFITGFSEYMSDGFDVEALHYLLKPVSEEKLFSVLDRYLKHQTSKNEITVKCESGTIHISPDSIIYCEAVGKKTHIHTLDKILICEMGIGNFSKNLSTDFLFCHRSYVVNLRYVKSISKVEISLDNGEKIPLSRRLYKDVNEKFIRFYTKG